MSAEIEAARAAVKALIEENFHCTEMGYGPAERDLYHERHRKALLEALGITEVFCGLCGTWYAPDVQHNCFEVPGQSDGQEAEF